MDQPRFGVRITRVYPETVFVYQTVSRQPRNRYVVDRDADNAQRVRSVNIDNDEALLQAIRDALAGEL